MHQKQIVKDAFFLLAVIIFILVAGVVDAEEPLPISFPSAVLPISAAPRCRASRSAGVSETRAAPRRIPLVWLRQAWPRPASRRA